MFSSYNGDIEADTLVNRKRINFSFTLPDKLQSNWTHNPVLMDRDESRRKFGHFLYSKPRSVCLGVGEGSDLF